MLTRFTPPQAITSQNYSEILRTAHLAQYLATSVTVTVGAAILLLVVSSLAGYGFSMMRFKGRRVILMVILGAMMVPIQVILVPFYQLMVALDLVNTRVGLILSYTAFFTPFSVYMMTAYYRSIPGGIVEAARMDGASLLQIWWWLMVPLGMPALITLGILDTIFCWNDVLIALLVLQVQRTVMVGLTALRDEYNTNYPLLAAGLAMAAAPIILLFVVFQRRIMAGVTVGAVKG